MHTHAHHQHPHQPAYSSAHLTRAHCPISFFRSGLMLLQLVTCLLTLIPYLPPVSSPACSSQLYSIVCVSKDLHECVSIVQDCEVCAPFPLSTSSCESKRTSIITLIILLCLFIELVTHLHQLSADSTDCNKTHLLYSNHLSESASLTHRASIWYNTKLKIDKRPFCWTQWANKGIWFLDNLYEGEHVVSFNNLKQKYNLPNNDFWKYLHIRHCLLATIKNGPDPPMDIQHVFVTIGHKKEVVQLSLP